jgi:hypothetical protein
MSKRLDLVPTSSEVVSACRSDVDILNEVPRDAREERLIVNLFEGQTIKEAAIAAGYSRSFASSAISNKVRSPEFKRKMLSHAAALKLLELPAVLQGEAGVTNIFQKAVIDAQNETDDEVRKAKEDRALKILAKSRHTLKETKQIAGLLQPDFAPQGQVVNIQGVQNLMLQLQNSGK